MREKKSARFGEHHNAFGFLRLFFASLVIASHVPEIVDNNPRREVLYRLTGTTTAGWLAVAGFFLISGYLITGSLVKSPNLLSYATKRVARIYPAFIAASILCLVVVAPLAGATFPHGPVRTGAGALVRMLILARPAAHHPFSGSHFDSDYGALDGAVWSIQYEFACYVLIALLAVARLIRGAILVVLSIVMLTISVILPSGRLHWLSHEILFPGPAIWIFQLSGLFLAGAAWYVYRQKVRFSPGGLLVATAGLFISLLFGKSVGYGLASFGGYLVFGIAALGAETWLENINNKTDISYGVYVYAWPIEQLLIRAGFHNNLLLLGLLTWVVALVFGWFSWTFIEKPVLKLAQRRRSYVASATLAPNQPNQTSSALN